MPPAIDLDFARRPSVPGYMLRALWPSPGLRGSGGYIAGARARWPGLRLDGAEAGAFRVLTGLGTEPGQSLLLPQVLAFPLNMALLTHPRFPLPIWDALQVRNCLELCSPFPPGAALAVETFVSGQRRLAKGLEVDLRTELRSASGLHWRGCTSFYYRGNVGAPDAQADAASPPAAPTAQRAHWQAPHAGRWAFCRLSGDFNGIHLWDAYARRFGFRGAFLHPQRALAQCLAHLPAPPPGPQRLQAWLRGPLHYGSAVELRAQETDAGTVFALFDGGDPRPALLGRWTAGLDRGADACADATGA